MLDYDLAENDFKRARQAVQTHMVLRKAGYQGAVYRGQYKEKQRYPVIGAVLYWGKGHWNYPRDLKELMHEKLTARELDYVDDVHLDVYEMAHLPKDVRERFKVICGLWWIIWQRASIFLHIKRLCMSRIC